MGGFTPILAASPEDTRSAFATGWTLAHLAYQVTPELTLRRGLIGVSMRGGVMVLSDTEGARGSGDPEALFIEVQKECILRGYSGLVADFEHPVRRGLSDFVRLADTRLPAKDITLFVYERYAQFTRSARVLFPTAMTSGALSARLRDAQETYGKERVSVEIERLARDIVLPSPQGVGTALSRESLQSLLAARRATVFFSSELCAHYFTYKDKENKTHFILYDDAVSIGKKLSLCRSMGIREAFLLYPEIKEFWHDLT